MQGSIDGEVEAPLIDKELDSLLEEEERLAIKYTEANWQIWNLLDDQKHSERF